MLLAFGPAVVGGTVRGAWCVLQYWYKQWPSTAVIWEASTLGSAVGGGILPGRCASRGQRCALEQGV